MRQLSARRRESAASRNKLVSVERPGRNQLCPCGSGKKYKRCCLGKEAQRREFARDLESYVLPLLRELGQFSAQRAGVAPEKIAAEHFPFWRPPLDRLQTARLLDYLIFDYRPQGHASSAVREFHNERGPLLRNREQRFLAEWMDTTTRLYLLESWAGGFAQCRPVGNESENPIDVMPLESGPKVTTRRSPMAVRALPAGPAFIYPTWPITFGLRSAEDVTAAVEARHHAFVRRERIVSFEEFLRLAPTVFDEEAAVEASRPRIILPGS